MIKYFMVIYMLLVGIENMSAGNLNQEDKVLIEKLINKTLKNQNLVRKSAKRLSSKEIKSMPKYVIYAKKRYTGKGYIRYLFHKAKNLKKDGIKTLNFSFKVNKIDCLYLKNDSVNCYVKESIKATFVSEDNFLQRLKAQERLNIKFYLKKDAKMWHIEEENILSFESITL